ncbi:MAG: Na(+)-translocating NADH-quinone reductase subunit A [Paramuribaculum sp.]|nr:Na(+)-translocating NADH-quinone reductase subunit A [Paramuribaculum sp.]
MGKSIKLNRGLDLRLEGGLDGSEKPIAIPSSSVAIYPDDFPGFTPKLSVREGDLVKPGTPLMFDKVNEQIKLVSPAGGKVKAVVRGERRKIIRVEVETENGAPSATVTAPGKSADEIATWLQNNGFWAMMRQRPYDIVPTPGVTPVNIFVTAFDSAPLALSLAQTTGGAATEIAKGLELLKTLTSGEIYVSTRRNDNIELPSFVHNIIIEGPHPAGNPGVQIANIAPVNKGETVWTLDIVTVMRIGRLALTGVADWSTTVAIVGSEVKEPRLVTTQAGAAIAPLIAGATEGNERHLRIIAGNVLTGVNAGENGFLHFPYRQVTVIPEGDDVDEFMGWASMSPKKMSVSRSFISSLLPGKKFAPDARLNGGRRAMIMSEQYDKVMPMDILPEYLIKAVLARDIDQMERLGIYEVAPEDFALCEYVDPSKLELQKIVREGLDYLRKELE